MFNISKTEYKKIDKKSIVSEKAGLCFCQNYDKATVITKSGILSMDKRQLRQKVERFFTTKS